MMGWFRSLMEFDGKGLLVDRVVGDLAFTRRGYCFDRRVFRVYLIVVFGMLALVMFSSSVGVHEFYLSCPVDGPSCSNPYYLSCDRVECESIRGQEFLRPGFHLGTPPTEEFGRLVRDFLLVVVLGFVLAFVVNHLLHNRGRSLSTIVELEDE